MTPDLAQVRSRPARPGSTGSGLNTLGSATSLGSLGLPNAGQAAGGDSGLLRPPGAPW